MKEVYETKNLLIEKGDIEDSKRPFKLREVEILELDQLSGMSPTEGVSRSIEHSLQDGNVYYRGLCKHTGDLKFILGVCQVEDTKMGVPWMLSSENFKPDWEFIRGSKRFVGEDMFINDTNILCNYISKDNKKTIKWLTWLGFKFTPHPYNNDFLQFYKYKE